MFSFQCSQAKERRKQQIIKEEKERLLRYHMPYIENFLPKGLLENDESSRLSKEPSE
jgi:hypothetical protein